MIFSCTKKVLDKLKKHKEIDLVKEEIGLHNWYVNSIILERKNYFLFMNSLTLFCFFVYAGTKKEHQDIEAIFENKLKEQIVKLIGSSDHYLANAFPKNNTHKFTSTNSRSVIGSLNDIKHQIEHRLWRKGEKLEVIYDELNHTINRIPMGALKYAYANEEMKAALETKK